MWIQALTDRRQHNPKFNDTAHAHPRTSAGAAAAVTPAGRGVLTAMAWGKGRAPPPALAFRGVVGREEEREPGLLPPPSSSWPELERGRLWW